MLAAVVGDGFHCRSMCRGKRRPLAFAHPLRQGRSGRWCPVGPAKWRCPTAHRGRRCRVVRRPASRRRIPSAFPGPATPIRRCHAPPCAAPCRRGRHRRSWRAGRQLHARSEAARSSRRSHLRCRIGGFAFRRPGMSPSHCRWSPHRRWLAGTRYRCHPMTSTSAWPEPRLRTCHPGWECGRSACHRQLRRRRAQEWKRPRCRWWSNWRH